MGGVVGGMGGGGMGVLPAFAYFATVCYIYTGKYKICHEGTPEIIGTPQRLPTNTAGTGAKRIQSD